MSARETLMAGLRAALEGHAPLRGAVTGVFDAPPVRAARPYALIDEPLLVDWGAKGIDGREGRVAVLLFDLGERPARLRSLVGEVEAAIAGGSRGCGADDAAPRRRRERKMRATASCWYERTR